jgi:parallel beta-helix repeat protein
MAKKSALTYALILSILLLSWAQFTNLSSANFFPYPGPDLPRIYIKSGGSIEPATAPIERSGNQYTLTDNIILNTIEIQGDNIVLNGAGHMIQGNSSWMGYEAGNNGLIIAGRKNVNVTGLAFEGCYTSIRVVNCSSINIKGNSFSTRSSVMGIAIANSMFVLVEENTFTDLRTDRNVPAIRAHGSTNIIRNNRISGSTYGIQIQGTSNVVSNNKIEVALPIILDGAQSNIIIRNTISGSNGQRGIEGVALFAKCANNLIIGNTMSGFTGSAIRFVFNAENNTVYGNYLQDNGFAVVIQERAVNNMFYGNTFAADSCNVSIFEVQSTSWDNGTLGNYWGEYKGKDGNSDGVGDTPFKLSGYIWDQKMGGLVSAPAGQDNYPLMAPYDVESEAVRLPQNQSFLVILFTAIAALLVCVVLFVYFKRKKRLSWTCGLSTLLILTYGQYFFRDKVGEGLQFSH